MTTLEKPSPRGEGLNGEFYGFCARDELRFQKCSDCGSWRHMPRHACPRCHSLTWTWEISSGRGRLYSWTVCHRSFHPAFNESIPYAVCVIEMEEDGVRVLSQIVGLEPAEFRLGMSVEVAFLARGNTKIPVFQATAS